MYKIFICFSFYYVLLKLTFHLNFFTCKYNPTENCNFKLKFLSKSTFGKSEVKIDKFEMHLDNYEIKVHNSEIHLANFGIH